MNRRKLETLLITLESTPALIARAARDLSSDEIRRKPRPDVFSFVENVWHLADLEREGYGTRIRRILTEEDPSLSDFAGNRLARERCYNERDPAEGMAAFSRARARNVEALRMANRLDWNRRANQEGVGRISLEDIPKQMARHDASHTRDLAGLLAYLREGVSCPGVSNSAVA